MIQSNPLPKDLNNEEIEKEMLAEAKKPVFIKQAKLQAETFWPGKVGTQTHLSPENLKGSKALYIPGQRILIRWPDGSYYSIPETNVKGVEHL